jgi:hypothetical protein
LGYIGIATLLAERRFPEFYMSSAVVSVGVVWSLLLAYHEVNLAPYQQLKELELIGDQYGGLEPTLMIEYSPYAVRHFLRRNQAEGAGELRVSPVTMADGTQLPKGEYADIDEFALPSIMAYQTLVLRRSPVASRPPANYVLQGQDRFYEVWQVGEVAPIPTEHIPLGDQADPTGTLSCVTIRDKADEATRTGGRLAAVVRPQPITVPLTGTTHPADWTSGQRVVLRSSGTLTTSIDVAAAGEYEFWLRGWVRGTVRVLVDGVQVGQLSQQLNQYENYSSLGVGEISAGRHELQLEYSAPWFAPGVGGSSDAVDPLVMSPVPTTTDVVQVPAADYQSLCGKQLDWLEVVH